MEVPSIHLGNVTKTNSLIFTNWLVDSKEASVSQDLEDLVGWKYPICFPLIHIGVDLLVDDLQHR